MRRVNRSILPLLEAASAPRAEDPLRHPVIFIIGAPRSGSTMLMQLLTDAFDFGYLSNCHCRYFGAPGLAEKLLSPLRGRLPSDYQSRHGATALSYEPAECASWWYRFFPHHPAYVTVEEANPAKMRRMRRSVAALVNAFDRPVLFKNLYAAVRLGPIIHYLPEALFIVISRDELENARSLLKGRKETSGGYDAWWSVEPPGSESLRALPPYRQVVEQVRHIHAQIERDLDRFSVPDSKVHKIRYESVCEDTIGCLADLEIFLARNKLHVNRLFATPKSFKHHRTTPLDAELESALADYTGNTRNPGKVSTN
jgi:hypothetical protein